GGGDRLCVRFYVLRPSWLPRLAGRQRGRVQPATLFPQIRRKRERVRSDRDQGFFSAGQRPRTLAGFFLFSLRVAGRPFIGESPAIFGSRSVSHVHSGSFQFGTRSRLPSSSINLSPSGVEKRIARTWSQRSEEHTSELQSPCNLVCRLLLEKK